MFWARVVFSVLLAGIITGALVVDLWLESDIAFTVVFGFFVVMATAEFFVMAGRKGYRPFATLGTATTAALVAAYWADQNFTHQAQWVYMVAFSFILALFLLQAFISPREEGVVSVALTVFGVFYIWVLAGFIQRLCYVENVGMRGVIVFLVTVKSSDMGAYLTGKFLGRHHPFKKLSPGKTVEGYVGGVVASVIAGVASGGLILRYFHLPWYWWAVFGGVMWLFGSMGDLFESAIKRDLGSKDSTKLIPGLGGVFDQLDSVLLAGPAAYIMLAGLVQ